MKINNSDYQIKGKTTFIPYAGIVHLDFIW